MQFFHISGFGHRARPGQGRHATAAGMLGEACRQPGSIAHLSEPRPAQILHGKGFGELMAILADIKDRARDCAGRRLRCDAALLMFAVASYPVLRSDLTSAAAIADYEAWRLATISWITDKMGPQVASIIEHEDELYPHLHFVLSPAVSVSGRLDWTRVHPGRAAKELSAARGDSATAQNALYRRAMSTLQDEFFEAVGNKFDHARVGPRRARRERKHHLQTREAAAAASLLKTENAALLAKIESLQLEASRLASQLQARSHANPEPKRAHYDNARVFSAKSSAPGKPNEPIWSPIEPGNEPPLDLQTEVSDEATANYDIEPDTVDSDDDYTDRDFDDVDRVDERLWDEADILDGSDQEGLQHYGEREEADY